MQRIGDEGQNSEPCGEPSLLRANTHALTYTLSCAQLESSDFRLTRPEVVFGLMAAVVEKVRSQFSSLSHLLCVPTAVCC